jgi:hypothetical protein
VKGFKCSILSYYCVIRVRASGSSSRLGALVGVGAGAGQPCVRAPSSGSFELCEWRDRYLV